MALYYTDNAFYLLILHGIAAHWLYVKITNFLTGNCNEHTHTSHIWKDEVDLSDVGINVQASVADVAVGTSLECCDAKIQTHQSTVEVASNTITPESRDQSTSYDVITTDASTSTFTSGLENVEKEVQAVAPSRDVEVETERYPVESACFLLDDLFPLRDPSAKKEKTDALTRSTTESNGDDDFEVLKIIDGQVSMDDPDVVTNTADTETKQLESSPPSSSPPVQKPRRRSRSRGKAKKPKVQDAGSESSTCDSGTWTNPVYFESRRMNPRRLKKMQYLSKLPPASILLRALYDGRSTLPEESIKFHLQKAYSKAVSNRDTQFVSELLNMEDDMQLVSDRQWQSHSN